MATVKQELRKQVLAARNAMPPAERSAKSSEIAGRLFDLPAMRSAGTVLFFAAFRSEVDTAPMIRLALDRGMRVVLPKVQGRELGLFEISDYARDVSPGAWGIPEPTESHPVRLEQVDVVIVPGAAFDERGNRLGYGAGFYDKLLPAFTGATIALAFELQIVPAVPTDLHDVPVRRIVTETRVLETARSS